MNLSSYQRFRQRWGNCKRCPLHKTRNKIVLCRGKVPAEILFIGEAPGLSEDVLGQPFVGPAGHLFQRIIDKAIDAQFDYCLTNLICCIPLEDGKKVLEPTKESITACQPRMKEFINLVHPKLVVRVGKLSSKNIGGKLLAGIPTIDLVHPAAILRMEPAQQGLAIQRCIVSLEDAVADLEEF